MNHQSRFDIAVVGGGPAGLAAAIALQQSGFTCAVFDGQHPPVDKACGEGLMPDALDALKQLGVSLCEADGFPIQRICFHGAARTAAAAFTRGGGLGVRRTRLHEQLVRRAEALGVQLFWNTPVSLGAGRELLFSGDAVGWDWLVVADGHNSTLAKTAGFAPARLGKTRFAARQHYALQPWTDAVEVYWGHQRQIYVTPVSAHEVGVALLGEKQRHEPQGLAFKAALAEFPPLAERLRDVPVVSRMRGAVTSNRRLPRVYENRVFLIGDASGSVDAITGEGLAIAFRQALLLARALGSGQPDLYEQGHRKLARMPRRMARVLLAMNRWPALERTAIDALARRPELFAALLDLHTGKASLAEFTRQDGWKLVWQLLRSAHSRENYALLTEPQ